MRTVPDGVQAQLETLSIDLGASHKEDEQDPVVQRLNIVKQDEQDPVVQTLDNYTAGSVTVSACLTT